MAIPIPVTRTVVEPDLDNCPVGFLFRGSSPDWEKEERFFAGLEAPLNHPFWSSDACFHVIEDVEGKALEHIAKSETLIITKDRDLTDHRVEARVRQFIPGSMPNMDDEYCTVARNGLVFRLQDLRRYYQFCLEGYDRVVLSDVQIMTGRFWEKGSFRSIPRAITICWPRCRGRGFAVSATGS